LRGYEIGKEVRWVARSSKSDELREQAGWGEQQEGSGEEARGIGLGSNRDGLR
jgi:hypothetical protein